MGWIKEMHRDIPDWFLKLLFEKVLNTRFTDKVKFSEVEGGYSFFKVRVSAGRYFTTEDVYMKTFIVDELHFHELAWKNLRIEYGVTKRGEIYYRFDQKTKEQITEQVKLLDGRREIEL